MSKERAQDSIATYAQVLEEDLVDFTHSQRTDLARKLAAPMELLTPDERSDVVRQYHRAAYAKLADMHAQSRVLLTLRQLEEVQGRLSESSGQVAAFLDAGQDHLARTFLSAHSFYLLLAEVQLQLERSTPNSSSKKSTSK
ncbi:hypothetical protein [Corallococcus exercitus]|uniref:hypothetical protein n=1 Tax=Corallococcus exercitus TaxID=2316736 RepID=UPI0035D44186